MATVEDFVLRMKVEGQGNVKQLSGTIQSLKSDLNDLSQVGGPLGGTINGIVGKLGPLGAAASLAGLAIVGLGSRALALAGELSDISGATGIAAGTLMNFRQSVVEAGGKADDFAQIAAKLNQSIQEAASGNETFQKSFQKLGVYVTDANGQVRNTETILRDVVARFQDGKMSSEQYAAAIDILGKNINKLELAKLKAVADPIKDEQIKQLDKYNDAIDKLTESVNSGLITAFGKLAIAINNAFDNTKFTDLEKQANLRGNTRQPSPGAIGAAAANVNPFGLGGYPAGERPFTEKEKALFEQQKRLAEQEKLMASYKSRAPAEVTAGAGGYGAEPESVKAAREASDKKIAQSRLEQNRQTQLTVNSERLNAILLFADQQSAIELKTASAIKDIEINAKSETSKARLDIYAQEKLSEKQKSAEFAAKEKEISLKAGADIAKARAQGSESLTRERERIENIITQSKARVIEEENLNVLLQKRNQFINDNAAMTDKERERAQQIFELEQERLKVLRQIALIKDLPQDERLRREKEINDIFDQRKIKTIEQQDADKKLQENFSVGFEKAYRQYAEDARNNFERASKLFGTFTRGMEDALVSFAKTGKLSFGDLVNTIIEEILRAEIRLLASNIMGYMSPSGGGGGLGKLLGFANGGMIPTNGPVIVGERGPELLMGAAGRQVIPNGQFGGGSVTYNIQAVDAGSFKALVARDPGFIHAVAQAGARSVPTRR